MAQDQKNNPLSGIGSTQPKTPAERARQIQEMQRQMDATPVAQPVATPAATAPTQSQPVSREQVQKAAEVYDAKAVKNVEKLSAPPTTKYDMLDYAATQAPVESLFKTSKGDDHEVTGEIWKVIKFGPPDVAPMFDVKKPIENYELKFPQQAVKVKQDANLFALAFTPKTPGEPVQKKAVLVDNEGNLKGAEFKNDAALQKGLSVPSIAMNLFRMVFGEGVDKDDIAREHRITKVGVGKQSTFEVVIGRKNPVNGKWDERTVPVNNFGQKVPAVTTGDKRKHDLVVAMYYLDRFSAA